ncbi:YoaK family protein [Chitinibacteraceae bacterium HSL-7]
MINKLPGWVETGGFLLAANAGFLNAIGLMGFEHQSISHLTGATSFLSQEIARGDWFRAMHLLWVVLAFVAGAMLSGLLIGNSALRLGRRYGVALLIESALLVAALWLLMQDSASGHFFASAACGLQNAMTSTFSGALVRTTHVSGLFTDLGVMAGQALRGIRPDRRRCVLYLTLIAGFAAGGVAGATAFMQFGFFAIAFASALTALLALAYWLFVHGRHAVRTSEGE